MERKHDFDQSKLDVLITQARQRYEGAETFGAVVGAMESLYADFPSQFLDAYTTKLEGGYTRHPTMPVEFLQRAGTQFYRCYMVKPQSIQDAEFAQIAKETESTYRQSLRAAYDAHLEQIIQDSVRRAEAVEQRKAEAARAKLIEQARKDAVLALGVFDEAYNDLKG